MDRQNDLPYVSALFFTVDFLKNDSNANFEWKVLALMTKKPALGRLMINSLVMRTGTGSRSSAKDSKIFKLSLYEQILSFETSCCIAHCLISKLLLVFLNFTEQKSQLPYKQIIDRPSCRDNIFRFNISTREN